MSSIQPKKHPTEFAFVKFQKSQRKYKKYDAVLQHKRTKKVVLIPFGDTRYQQFHDSTGLGLYSHLDHNDEQRRQNYWSRHRADSKVQFSAGFFAANYLW
jgi:hypothetical protein